MISKTLSPLLAICLIASCSSLLSTAKTDFNVVGKEMAGMLQNSHYARLPFDEELSKKIFDTYLKQLDPTHLFFTQKDVATLREKYETNLHDLLIRKKCMEPATEIYSLYSKRVKERVEMAQEILKKGEFDFKSNATVLQTRVDAPWPADDQEAEKVWSQQIEEALLAETLRRETIRKMAADQGKEDPLAKDPAPKDKVLQRYERIVRSVEEADEEDVANYFLSAVAQAHDPHTDYQSAREADRFKSAMANSLVGIGAMLRSEDDGATRIMGIVVGGPADKAGELKLDDRVIGVDPKGDGNMQDIMFRKIDHVVDLIRGKEGVKVSLKVEPAGAAPGETKIIDIIRGRVDLKEEAASSEIVHMKRSDGGVAKIGWMTLPSFYIDFTDGDPAVATDVRKLLNRLVTEKIDGLVIDLRGNGGGSLDEVMKMTSFFIGKGPVVQIKDTLGRTQQRESINGATRNPIYDGPLVIVTDKTSASASEILAGALQDYNRAVVVGDQSTFGKGTVQQPVPIGQFFRFFQDASRAGQLKVTIQKFYRVAGSTTQLEGVVPDLIFPSLMDAMEIGEAKLDHALAHDRIAPAKNFTPGDQSQLYLPILAQKSKARLSESKDFAYLAEDVKRLKELNDKNQVSLNMETRQKEIAESTTRRQERNVEKRERFAKVAEADAKRFEFYKLGLDDLDKETLDRVDLEKDKESYMRKAKEELAELNDTPKYPNDLDPVKRETLNVIGDLIDLTKAAQTAVAEKAEEALAE